MSLYQNEVRAKFRNDINRSLLSVCFTIFALMVSLKPALLHQTFFIPLQLTIAIPLLISSIFARSRLALIKKSSILEGYGYITFISSYAFIINVIGLLLANVVGLGYGITFLIANIVTSITYSVVEVLSERKKLQSRIRKDLFFALLILIGGILPSLGWY